MPQQKKNILITRRLSGLQRDFARSLGLNPIEKPALKFEFTFDHDHVLKMIEANPKASWVFTSKNGVRALEQLLNEGLKTPTGTHRFAVGSKTRQALHKLRLDAKIPGQHDGYHLAELIISEPVDTIIHFHGNLSRKEMRNKLVEHGIEVIDQEVYQTIIQPVTLPDEPVKAILFYSPSAVKGFKEGHGFKQPLPPLFAIGKTTAAALKSETGQSISVAEKPSTKALLQMVSARLF